MTAFRSGFPEPATENMRFFSIRPAKQNSCRKKTKVDQYNTKSLSDSYETADTLRFVRPAWLHGSGVLK